MRLLWVGPSVAMVMILGGCAATPPISISLSPAAQAVDQGKSFNVFATLTNDISAKGVRWTLSGPGSISGSSTIGTYSSPSTAITSAEQVTVTATSVADPTKTASMHITVNPYPLLGVQNLLDGTVGVPYSQPVVLNGGSAPFQWTVYNTVTATGEGTGGSVPSGLTLNAATGTISGTPTAAGTWYFTTIVTDADGVTESWPTSLQINPAPSTTVANAVPFLNQPLVPTAVAPGGSGLTLKVSGTAFVSGAAVNFNGTPLATTFVDSAHLSAIVPAADVATAKTASVTVTNPAPGGGSSNVVYFQVGAPEATVRFANALNSPLQTNAASGLAVADLNGDGKPDLVIAAGTRLYSMLGNGDGTFTSAPNSPINMPRPPYNNVVSPDAGPIAVGDFNHSGHPGLAVALFEDEAAVIFEGKGDGTFTTSSAFADSQGLSTLAIAAADFNGDGNLDLVIINGLNGVSPVLLGYGGGAFNTSAQLPNVADTVTIGDFNGDGKLDLAEGGPVLLGNGDGTFTAVSSSTGSPAIGGIGMVAADFNGDGKLDLAGAGNGVLVQLGNGDGTFQPFVTIPVGVQPYAIVAGDFNNDGKLDLAIANYEGTVTLLLGNGDGTFSQASGSPFLVGKGPVAIVAADFNGDGKLDLAVANSMDGTVSILLQQ